MKRLIYQVCLGRQGQSKLYKKCIESVSNYCQKHDIVHYVQQIPKLKIKPDVFMTNRSTDSYEKHGGFLPIYEKENAFDLLDEYDQIAIIDADIFIREDAPNIFEDLEEEYAWGSVVEREMPITDKYRQKIFNYSHMQYQSLHNYNVTNFYPDDRYGYQFFNMGMIVLNCKQFKPYLKGDDAHSFISRTEFQRFVDGEGAWKWSTDQTLLNYFLKKYDVPTKHMDWKWNGLYGANTKIEECHFVHFFLKDLLPEQGENVEELMKKI